MYAADVGDASTIPGLQVHGFDEIKFDASCMASGLWVDPLGCGRFVEQTNSVASHKVIYLSEGWSTGRHLVQFKILAGATHKYILIGVAEAGACSLTTSTYPGHASNGGVAYYGHNGYRYYSNTNAAYGEPYGAGDTIGILLNLDAGTVSFLKNGRLLGVALGSDSLKRGAKYFPVVALYEMGHRVAICDAPGPNPSSH